jgi:glutamine cyclotransferase
MLRVMTASIAPLLACACAGQEGAADFEVTATFAHDDAAYTQGLIAVDSVLIESTGRYGASDVRRVHASTGRVLSRRPLAATEFGEGLALHEGRLYQLTWKEGTAYVYDAETLAPLDTFRYAGEGWGLASDGQRLYMSDGSDSIRVLVPATFAVERVFRVTHQGVPLSQLNELEFFGGALLANVFGSNWIAEIDPVSGSVVRLLDFAGLYPRRPPGVEVMNGIAVTPDGTQLLLTGKLWPSVFQVRVIAARR